MYCIDCGSQIPDVAKFCPNCGSNQIRPEKSEFQNQSIIEHPFVAEGSLNQKNTFFKKWSLLITVSLVAVSLVYFYISYNVYGTMTLADGAKYKGEMKDGKPHGQGVITKSSGTDGTRTYNPNVGRYHPDGGRYEGEWKNGKQEGKGTWTWFGGRDEIHTWVGGKYEGEFMDDKFHGQGTMTNENGAVYEGGWKDGKRHGYGTEIWGGYKYEGGWKDGKKNGQGTETYDDNVWDKYVGQWKDGVFDGQGTLYLINGTQKSGIWENGELKYQDK